MCCVYLCDDLPKSHTLCILISTASAQDDWSDSCCAPQGVVHSLQDCSKHGVCVDEKCLCDDGWVGVVCSVPARLACPSNTLDRSGRCCPSGVLNRHGGCCEIPAQGMAVYTDILGSCCASEVDACGTCGGAGKGIDAAGKCCQVCCRAQWDLQQLGEITTKGGHTSCLH
jgi:EGF-like domain